MERKGVITFKGNPLTLTGTAVNPGAKAPDFVCIDKDLKEVRLKDFKGKAKLISVTPSLDTGVCDHQARRFNQEAARISNGLSVINVSMDLPFAIGRFCTTAGVDKVKVLSDHREASFGNAYGVLIKELRLLSRSVFLIDQNDTIRYMEIVPEITTPVSFEKALEEAGKLMAVRA